MFRVSLVYIILWFLFQLLVDCQMIPKQRQWHTATHINNKLYILGGVYLTNTSVNVNDFFYLDVSGTFNTKKLSWQDLSSNTIPAHSESATVVGGVNGNTLILYGGNTDDATMALVYTFDPIGKTWSTPNVTGGIRKQNMIGINNNGKMYIWGGSDAGKDSDSMLILNTINFNFVEGSIINAPSPRINYGGVLLPDQTIAYTGGFSNTNNLEMPLNVVYIYDTKNDTWIPTVAKGDLPSGRDGFSATLGLDNKRIIIFGGSSDVNNTYIPPGDALYELNLTNYQWRKPPISGQIPNSRNQHRANLVGRFIVISFGRDYSQETESDILLLDISNTEDYKWTEDFDPSLPSTTEVVSPTSSIAANNIQPSSKNSSILIGSIVGGLIGVALLAIGSFFLYRWYKKKKGREAAIQIPGSEAYQAERNFYNDERELL